MAALRDATVVTRQLLERTHELRRYLDDADADSRTMALLADEIAELADALATTFDEVEHVLSRSPFSPRASESGAAAARPPEARATEAEAQSSREPRRSWLATLLRPARWLGRRLRGVRQLLGSRTPSEQPEFA